MAREAQYAPLRSRPVCSTATSNATTAAVATSASAVYSCTAAPQDPAHGLERQQAADRDGDEEHELLDRHAARQRPPHDVPPVEGPVVAGDRERVPREEDGDGGDEH